MKQIILVAAMLFALRVLAADPPLPSPEPDPAHPEKMHAWMDQQQQDDYQIMTEQDLIDHPHALPNEKTPPEVRAKFEKKVREGQARMEAVKASWKSKPALDAIVGKDQPQEVKKKVVWAMIRYQVEMTGHDSKALAEIATRHAMDTLTATCPDVPPEKLAKLLKLKPDELYDTSAPKNLRPPKKAQ